MTISGLKRLLLSATAAVLLLTAAQPTALADEASPTYKVVFHVSEPAQMQVGINNVKNILKVMGKEHVKVMLLANSTAITAMLQENKAMAADLAALAKDAEVAVCDTSMAKMNLKKESFFPFCLHVDSGVAELVRRQAQGWAYIKS